MAKALSGLLDLIECFLAQCLSFCMQCRAPGDFEGFVIMEGRIDNAKCTLLDPLYSV